MTKNEQAFAKEFARMLLVDWADQTLRTGGFQPKVEHTLYLEIARASGWVSKVENKVIGAGFIAARGYLKR